MINMRVTELIKLSGLTEKPEYDSHDYAVPMYRDHRYGKYPHNGNAISVYWKGCYMPVVISYRELAEMAFSKGEYFTKDQRIGLRAFAMQEDEVDA